MIHGSSLVGPGLCPPPLRWGEASARSNTTRGRILNPWFFLAFFGAPVLTAVAAVLQLSDTGWAVLPWIVAALVLYGVVLAVTVGMNVPLNNALAVNGPPDRIADLTQVRASFEAAWIRWNIVRAVASTAAFGCLAWALVLYGRTPAATGASTHRTASTSVATQPHPAIHANDYATSSTPSDAMAWTGHLRARRNSAPSARKDDDEHPMGGPDHHGH